MSGVMALHAALNDALSGDTTLLAIVNSVGDGALPIASAPALLLGELSATRWGARGIEGLSVRVPLTIMERGDRPDRLAQAADRVAAVMAALPDAAGEWRIGAAVHDRSRTARGADGRWSLTLEYLVRLSREV